MAKRKKQHKSRKHRGLKRWKQLGFFGKVWRVIWVSIVSVFAFTIVQVLFCALFNPPITPLMVQRFFEQVKDPDRPIVFERDYVSIDDISPNLINAVAIAEDGGLYMYHHGLVYSRMKKAYINFDKNKSTRFGGSTITQQTAKNCFLPHYRNPVRKVMEAYYAILIEKIWGKKRIMECYLNIIEFGDGIYGCEAASQHYFHHSAKELTTREASLLAVCLPHPLLSNPAHPSRHLSSTASIIRHRMSYYGKIDWDKKREDMNPKYVKMTDEENLWDFIVWLVQYEIEHPNKSKK